MRRTVHILAAVAALSFGFLVSGAHSQQTTGKPNIVFILTDDLSTNLVQYMPNVLAMQKDGTTFANYFVTDSLCCPSRASIFTGKFPHNTGVFTNTRPLGGYDVFVARNNEPFTFAVSLQRAGYKTAMMGKYLNGYFPVKHGVPVGWNEWDVAGLLIASSTTTSTKTAASCTMVASR